jgi:hypothetical protein
VAQRISDAASERLARYWYRAQLMRDLVHWIVEESGDLKNLPKENWWELETFLVHWLSGLFVVVEGFNKLKLKDPHVQRLFKEHLNHLKRLRHETYHFTIERSPSGGEIIKQLNWAEELHDAISEFIREVIVRKSHAERFLERRKQAKK